MRAFAQGLNSSLNVPFVHQNTSLSSPLGDTSSLFPTASRNPNKAIITIDAQSSRILVANEMTCELFGYQKDELSGMKVQSLFTEPYRAKQQALVEQNIDSSGATVLISGKVVSMGDIHCNDGFNLESEESSLVYHSYIYYVVN